MSGLDFDRVIFNPQERPFSSDHNRAQQEAQSSIRDVLMYLMGGRAAFGDPTTAATSGWLGDAGKVVSVPGSMSVNIIPGVGFYYDPSNVPVSIDGIIGLDDLSQYKPMVIPSLIKVPVPPLGSLSTRVDTVAMRYNMDVADPNQREVFDSATGQFMPGEVNKTLSFSLGNTVTGSGTAIVYLQGTPTLGTPVPPALPSGSGSVQYVRMADILVVYNDTSVQRIVDRRKPLYPGGVARASIRVTATGGVYGSAQPTIATVQQIVAPPGIQITAVPPIATGLYPTSIDASCLAFYLTCGDFSSVRGFVVNGHSNAPASGATDTFTGQWAYIQPTAGGPAGNPTIITPSFAESGVLSDPTKTTVPIYLPSVYSGFNVTSPQVLRWIAVSNLAGFTATNDYPIVWDFNVDLLMGG